MVATGCAGLCHPGPVACCQRPAVVAHDGRTGAVTFRLCCGREVTVTARSTALPWESPREAWWTTSGTDGDGVSLWHGLAYGGGLRLSPPAARALVASL